MTTTALPTTALEGIEALDFDPDVACEWPTDASEGCRQDGAHPADWYVATHCTGPLPICDRALEVDRWACSCGMYDEIQCTSCGAVLPIEPYRVLGPVRA